MHFPARYLPNSQVGLMIKFQPKEGKPVIVKGLYIEATQNEKAILKHIHMNRFLSRWMKLIWGKLEAQIGSWQGT